MKENLVNKIGLIISIMGIVASAAAANWVAVCLWVIVILQDFRIIELEKRANE